MPYIVREKLKNLPVYKLRSQTGTGWVRTLHRDHLLSIRDSVRISPPSSRVEDMRPPIKRAQTAQENQLKERVSMFIAEEGSTTGGMNNPSDN